MVIKKILTGLCISVSLCTAPLVYAQQVDSVIDNIAVWKKTCTDNSGKVVDAVAQFDTGAGMVSGVHHAFCEFDVDDAIRIVGLETLSSKTPSLAATFVQSLVIDHAKALPEKPYANPALNVCENLHGSTISFYVADGGFVNGNNGQMDMCVFGDGSSISAWTMIYLADGASPQVKALMRSTPLAISIPDIYSRL